MKNRQTEPARPHKSGVLPGPRSLTSRFDAGPFSTERYRGFVSFDGNRSRGIPDFSRRALERGTGVSRTADWTDMEGSTPTLAFQRDGVFGTADWSMELGGAPAPRVSRTEDWSFEPGTESDAPLGGDGVNRTADWTGLLGD